MLLSSFSFLMHHAIQAQQALHTGGLIQKPESVATDGHYFYIADIGQNLDPSAKDGDGVIWKISKAGKQPGDTAFVRGLHAPKGVVINKGILFVTDIDRVLGFDLRTGQKQYDIDCSHTKTTLLNDLAVKDENTLLLSAMDINKLFVIHLAPAPQLEELVLTNPVTGPNGLVYSAREYRLYVCSFVFGERPAGVVGFIDLSAPTKQFTRLVERPGHYDGLALLNDSVLIVSDWVAFEKKGLLLAIHTRDKKITPLNKEPIAGPADFAVTTAGTIIVPEMMTGTILQYPCSGQ